MITQSNAAAVFARLVTEARRLAKAAAANRALQAGNPARRWRAARLLWPLFAKG